MCETGTKLKAERHKSGLSLAAVADELCIRAQYLDAIETGELDHLPGDTFTVGFVRAYADHLGLDSCAIVDAFKTEMQIDIAPSCGEGVAVSADVFMTPKSSVAGSVGASLFGLFGILAVWWVVDGAAVTADTTGDLYLAAAPAQAASDDQRTQVADKRESAAVETEAPKSATILTAKVAPQLVEDADSRPSADVQAAALRESLSTRIAREVFPTASAADTGKAGTPSERFLAASDDIWLSVTRSDGSVVWSGVLREGETYPLSNSDMLYVSTGNAGALSLVRQDGQSTLLGERGASLIDHQITAISSDPRSGPTPVPVVTSE